MISITENESGSLDVTKNGRTIRMSKAHRVYAESDLIKYGMFDTFADSVEWDSDLLDCSGPHLHRYKDGVEFELSGLPEEADAIGDYLRHFRPKTSSIIFDLGAHCGVSTYYLAKTAALVVAVEPDPINFACLYKNVVRHGLSNVALVCGAISDSNGWRQFNAEGSLGASFTTLQPNRLLLGRTSVATRTMWSLIGEYGEPDFVKMDIEGAEIDVMKSCLAEGILDAMNAHFVVDTCHGVGGEVTTGRIEQIFRDADYRVESERKNGICTWAWRP